MANVDGAQPTWALKKERPVTFVGLFGIHRAGVGVGDIDTAVMTNMAGKPLAGTDILALVWLVLPMLACMPVAGIGIVGFGVSGLSMADMDTVGLGEALRGITGVDKAGVRVEAVNEIIVA